MSTRVLFPLALAGALVAPALALAMGEPTTPHPPADAGSRHQCYFTSQIGDWRAPDARTILFRVNRDRVLRLDLANACPELTYIDPKLITRFRGNDTICTALDWDIKVAPEVHTPGTPCIVKDMRELTPAEIAALPKKDVP